MAAKTDIIFCGNPGVGKSSIATSISGIQFRSGVSFGCGLTVELTWNEAPALPNVRFADTPGLADAMLKEQAAKAITEALAQGAAKGHKTKIIFVVTTEAGRLRPEDMYTIKLVMESIKLANGTTPGANSYAIVINKCPFLDSPAFLQGGSAKIESMLTNTNIMSVPSAYIKYLPAIPEIAGQDNAKVFFDGLLEWVLGMAPSIQVGRAEIIDTSSQEEVIAAMKAEHETQIKRLEALTAEQAKEMAAQAKATKDMKANMQAKLVNMEKKTREVEALRKKEAKETKNNLDRLEAQNKAEQERMEREIKEQKQALEKQKEAARKEFQVADERRKKEIDEMQAKSTARFEQMKRDMEKQQQEAERSAELLRRDAKAAAERADAASRAASAQGDGGLLGALGGTLGAIVTPFVKPIAQAIVGQPGPSFERNWNRSAAQAKEVGLI